MKTFLLAFSLLIGLYANAQYCTIDSQYVLPGLYPLPEDLPCFVGGGEWNDVTVQFVMFDSTEVSGIKVKVEYVIIDEILNLPCGITWCTSENDADTANRFNNQERGCIRFRGRTTDDAGQYKLVINVKAKVSLLQNEVPYNAENLGFRVDVRLVDVATDPCPAIDTTSGATLLTATCPTDNYCPIIGGVNEISSLSKLTLSPNPASNTATVSFIADKAAVYTSRIINIYGQKVSHGKLDVISGLNVDKLDISQLPAGVYIYTLTDGKSVLTQRFVVE